MGAGVFRAAKMKQPMMTERHSVAQNYLDQQSVLLTWNGPWGELSQDPLLLEVWPFFSGVVCNAEGHAVLPFSTGVSEGGFPQPALGSVAKFVRCHPRIAITLHLLETASVYWQGLCQIPQYAWSLEMCTRSWADQSEVRVHIHAFCRHDYKL